MKKKSTQSLVAGVGSGALLAVAAYTSNAVLGLVLAVVLGGIMFKRYQKSKKVMPAGMVSGLSAIMALYFFTSM
eukprot:CAMPEP_0182857346 /NCGR_PEP_ID=MMETSP0034_2-20130328/2997_1 /TAXON_ID=156128 /ORGANISM="Nephroselmis pyriformis, Strain CCMP717" /LENGTH=73 /DNA_ID=CAMNT_0024988579 /DNA_START=207 /DNA_END=428 /DNA_ORIENTATION=+